MRYLRGVIVTILAAAFYLLLNTPLGGIPALGRLLDPVSGWGANAEAVDKNYSIKLPIKGLEKPVTIWIEDRLVPHIQAANDHDLYFVQGYIHAYFRLWQMDMQTRAAAGRVGEVVGEKWVTDPRTGRKKNVILEFDRTQRRKGMVYAAERSLQAMEEEPHTKTMLDAYTAGINQYISSLKFRDYPLEYKLMDFSPEPWTNLKCALLLKYMADDLTGYTEDIALTMLKDALPADDFNFLYPERIQGSAPVIPKGTLFDAPSLAVPKAPAEDVWAHFGKKDIVSNTPLNEDYDDGIGSNNWAISGSRTASGAPLLCNDPHLGLNLPSLWFEMQLQAPNINVYGVSLPGAPGVIIGFNDSLSWGLTNNYRDVKDFYEIDPIDQHFYAFNDRKPMPFDERNEVIGIKGKEAFVDTVHYTVHGPVMYDAAFPEPSGSNKTLAMCWMAHRPTNELLAVYYLNRAQSYTDFTEAIMHFQCPAQNFIYADRQGNIALWGQGQFINKWKDQGRYVMKGNTAATLWGQDIPMMENPHALNPEQGYLASANQVTTDTTYPYWYNGYFYDFRAWRINELLSKPGIHNIASEMHIQNDKLSILARNTFPLIDSLMKLDSKSNWNDVLDADDATATRFQVAWSMLYEYLWKERFGKEGLYPSVERTMQLLMADTGKYNAVCRSTLTEIAAKVQDSLRKLEKNSLAWYKVKGTQLTHLTKIDAFSYRELKIGGWGNTLNAAKKTHGPSWRMIVSLDKDSIRAFGVYPGGQSGNPGSPYYGTFVNKWVNGDYYRLLFLPQHLNKPAKGIRYTWTIQPEK